MGDTLRWLVLLALVPVGLVAFDWFSRETVPGRPSSIILRLGHRETMVNRWAASLLLTFASATLVAAAMLWTANGTLSVLPALAWGLVGGGFVALAARNHARAFEDIRRWRRAVYSKSQARRGSRRGPA